jgi:hypothetical protein
VEGQKKNEHMKERRWKKGRLGEEEGQTGKERVK